MKKLIITSLILSCLVIGGLMTYNSPNKLANQSGQVIANFNDEAFVGQSQTDNTVTETIVVASTSEDIEPIETESEVQPIQKPAIPTFTKDTLAIYDGTNLDLPIYIAFDGDVYDVTAGRKFYEAGGMYHFLAGTDGTTLLKTFGGDLIKEKYKVVGKYLE